MPDNQVTTGRADNLQADQRLPGVVILPDLEIATTITADAPRTILLAEDDPVARMLMTRFLKKAGYEVDAVSDGAQAFDKMMERYYPILISDWEMPGMDGLSLCKAVRNMQLDGYVYALLLTAKDAKEHIIAGLEAGADDYLVKPVHEPELVARLNAGRRILDLEHSLRVANQRNRVLSITDALTGCLQPPLSHGTAAARNRALPPVCLSPCRSSCATSTISSRSTTRRVMRRATTCCSSS